MISRTKAVKIRRRVMGEWKISMATLRRGNRHNHRVIRLTLLVKTTQHRPRDPIIQEYNRKQRDQKNFETMAIHILIRRSAGSMPPLFT